MTEEITLPNPYRTGSHLYHLFDILKDGDSYLVQRTEHLLRGLMSYEHWRAWNELPYRIRIRRVASALRTIRAHPRLNIIYDRDSETYHMVQLTSGDVGQRLLPV